MFLNFQIYEAFELKNFGFGLFKQRNYKDEIISSRSKTVSDVGLAHGDMVYFSYPNGKLLWDGPSTSGSSSNISAGISIYYKI